MFDPTTLRDASRTIATPEERSMRVLEWAISLGVLVFAVALGLVQA